MINECKMFMFVAYIGYHDVAIRLPLVTSTVQCGEGNTQGRVVCSGDGRTRMLFYNDMQHLQYTNIHAYIHSL